MNELVKETVKDNDAARGLVIIISNDYMNGVSNQRRLYGAIKDADVIRETFKYLNFAIIDRRNATKVETQSLIIAVANYEHYPKKYDCFAVVFAGHGSGKPMILSSDDKEVDLNEELLKPLDSEPLHNIPKLIFIDACRSHVEGDKDNPLIVKDDFLVAYSTRYGEAANEDRAGGIWMQKLAAELKSSPKSVPAIITDVNKAVRSAKQGAQLINTTVDIQLQGRILHQDQGYSGSTRSHDPECNRSLSYPPHSGCDSRRSRASSRSPTTRYRNSAERYQSSSRPPTPINCECGRHRSSSQSPTRKNCDPGRSLSQPPTSRNHDSGRYRSSSRPPTPRNHDSGRHRSSSRPPTPRNHDSGSHRSSSASRPPHSKNHDSGRHRSSSRPPHPKNRNSGKHRPSSQPPTTRNRDSRRHRSSSRPPTPRNHDAGRHQSSFQPPPPKNHDSGRHR